jgi:hypothetical protein
VLKETERDPFEDAEDEDEAPPNPPAASGSSVTPVAPYHTTPTKTMPVVLGSSGHGFFDSGPKKSKKDKKGGKKKSKPFNLEEEKVKMKSAIAESSVASVNLLNSLKLINRENERVSENVQAAQRFETCKMLRRHILRYVSNRGTVTYQYGPNVLINSTDSTCRIRAVARSSYSSQRQPRPGLDDFRATGSVYRCRQ